MTHLLLCTLWTLHHWSPACGSSSVAELQIPACPGSRRLGVVVASAGELQLGDVEQLDVWRPLILGPEVDSFLQI